MTTPIISQQQSYSTIRITGVDSAKFLQGQLTCDLDKLNPQQAALGGYANVQGRLFAVFYLLQDGEDYLMLLPNSVAESTLQRLSMFAVFFQTELSIDKSFRFYAKQSPARLNSYQLQQNSDHLIVSIKGADLYLLKPAAEVTAVFTSKELVEYDLWRLSQINAGIPMIYEPTLESLLPHYIGLANEEINGISFSKGCYTGQEVIARMHYRGTLKTHAVKASISNKVNLLAGQIIQNEAGKKVGELIDSVTYQGVTHCLLTLADKALEQPIKLEEQLLTLV